VVLLGIAARQVQHINGFDESLGWVLRELQVWSALDIRYHGDRCAAECTCIWGCQRWLDAIPPMPDYLERVSIR
jgi:hypothetical protein